MLYSRAHPPRLMPKEFQLLVYSLSFSKDEKWYDKLFNVKYLPLFHHFKAIYQFPKQIIFLVKIVANASLNIICINLHDYPVSWLGTDI
jgi:hypothetical protein